MKRIAGLLIVTAALAVSLSGSGRAGSYGGPFGDCCPVWSPGSTQILFHRWGSQPAGLAVISPSGGPEHVIEGIPDGVRSPDWTRVAYVKSTGDASWLAVAKVDGSDERLTVENPSGFSWSHDSAQLVVGTSDGLGIVSLDGHTSTIRTYGQTSDPSWSSSGAIAFFQSSGLYIHGLGRTDIELPGRPVVGERASWSPDGRRVAYWSRAGSRTVVQIFSTDADTTVARLVTAADGGPIVWTPDGKSILVPTRAGADWIEVTTAKHRTLLGVRDPAFSPNGRLLAYSAGGECRDRLGIYVAGPDGRGGRRITNGCRIVGTEGPDILHGDFSRVVFGLGGDDTLYADDTGYYFEGNTLLGGPGNDVLVGGNGEDILNGGPGDDTLSGGLNGDVLIGGPGRDHIDGGRGGDTIYARDGERDWITCGPNAYNRRDVVYADQYDVVAADCEVVHRVTVG